MTRHTHPSLPLLTASGTPTCAPSAPRAPRAPRIAARRRTGGWVVGLMVPLVIASSGGAWPLGAFVVASVRQDQPVQPASPQPEAQPPQPSTPAPAPTAKEQAEAVEAARRKVEADRAKFEELMRERRAKAAAAAAQGVPGGDAGRPPLVPGVAQAQPVPVGRPVPGEPNPNAQGEQGNQEIPNPNGEVIPVPNPEGAAVLGAPVEGGANPGAGALIGKNDLISMNFTDPVDLMAFVDWVSKSLNINIIADEGLTGRRIVFRAPVKVKADELLQLLSRLIEDQDFIFSRDPLGFYTIKSSAKIPIVLAGDGVDLPTTRIIPTPMVRPSIMQQAVQQAMGGGGGPGAQGGARITSIDDIGVMIVTGSAGALATVESLVQTIQHELTNQKLHRFTLEHVSADFALNRILTLNGKVSQQQGGFNGGVPVNPNAGGGAGGVSGSLTHLDARLFIDPGNAIIFRGTDVEAEQVKTLLSVIDVVNTLIARRYATGSVTSDVAAAGERIGLGPATQSGSSTNSSFSGGFSNFRNQGGGFNGQQGGGAGTSDLPGSGFAVDMEKGSIIYYGTETQHALVAQLVKTFTEQALNEDVEIRAYKLLYAKAEKVAEVLNSLLENPNDRTANSSFLPKSNTSRGTASPLVTPPEPTQAAKPAGTGGDEGATLTATKNDTVVVPDEDRNQILVKASGRQQREFARIIKKLDERQPQVYIEAKIVAVRIDDTFTYRSDLQIDGDAFQFLSSFGLTSAATNAAFNNRRNVVNPGTGTSGVTAALLNQDRVLGVIQALQVVGDARIVSTPRILVNDNEEAKQKSVREEPFAATSQTSGNPTVTSQGGTATAGTELTVTPTISQNGDIVLEYAIELSNFDRSAAANANLQPPKQTENYNSKVTVPSDTTIVVGGFTFESKQNTQNKVPFLGDIPIVGLLFKSIGEVTNRTTIFVFITPRVLTDPTGADLRILTEGPAKEMKIDGITPSMSPESIAISPSTISLPKLDQSDRTPGAIDPGHTPRRTPTRPPAEPVPEPTPESTPTLAPETMPEPTPVTQAEPPN